MSVTVAGLMKVMEELAPPDLAEEWDNIGLQVGDPRQKVERILVSLDVDERVVDEAVCQKADIILSHHPLIFRPIKNLVLTHPLSRIIAKLIKYNIAVFSAHTNLDIVPGGINDYLAEKLGLTDTEVLDEKKEDQLYKLVVFVPENYLDQVRDAICAAGAGYIGKYSQCTFSALGEGTFLPLEGTNPFLGEKGKLEKASEYRLETIIPSRKIKTVLNAMIKSHPYEEVAYDIYPTTLAGVKYGLGRVGYLPQPLSLEELILKVKFVLGTDRAKVVGDSKEEISKVAVCGGGGMSFLNAAINKGVQCFITGDSKYHEGQSALAQGINVIDAGHYETEAIFVSRLVFLLKQNFSSDSVEVVASKINTNPWRFY
ncbi:MAG: Nif3-like dinuclear metal center hexameric protein [Dehalobacterium sp.]